MARGKTALQERRNLDLDLDHLGGGGGLLLKTSRVKEEMRRETERGEDGGQRDDGGQGGEAQIYRVIKVQTFRNLGSITNLWHLRFRNYSH